ncbi:hypothetical protein CWI36_0101p0020 [Hamiltosporidium magnivora]|uniref:Uncharacterized protein n=1 Tax=Hamiltosporidium magnivora TaxID=148818 RepID=A0A4Q9LL21_9MICR|nr:hypothetical protein CWI36_0101p0020 [Hamiltosporidium magnivora]
MKFLWRISAVIMCLIAISKESMSEEEKREEETMQRKMNSIQGEILEYFQELEEKERIEGENRGCIRSEQTTERASRKKSSFSTKAQVEKSKRGSCNSLNPAASECSGAVGTTENESNEQTSSKSFSLRASTDDRTSKLKKLKDEEFQKRFNKNHRKIAKRLEELSCKIS